MELVDLSRYVQIENPTISPFSVLREMKPVVLTADLKLFDEPENLEYAKKLAKEGYNVVRIVRNPPLKNYKERIDFPRRILFEMTSNCNYLCKMCPQQNLKRPRMDMDKNLYKKVIDEIDSHGIEGIWLYHLGESLLHPDFKEIVEHVSSKKNLGAIWMSTNGEYFTEENIKTVLNSNIDWINYSAHSVTEETYFEVIGKTTFKVVDKNLETFYNIKGTDNLPRKPYLHCQMIEQDTTKHEVDAFIKKHYNRADIVSINMLEYVNLPNNAFGAVQRERKPLTSCTRVTRGDCFICSNGAVTLCDAAYNGEILLGNVNEQSLYDIWNSPERKKILKLNEEGKMSEVEFCKKCTDYDI